MGHLRCLSSSGQTSTLKFWIEAVSGSVSELPPSLLNFYTQRWLPVLPFFSPSYPLTHHNTPEGPTPLWAWPRLRSIEASHFWENKAGSMPQLQLWGVGWRPMMGKGNDCGKDLSGSKSLVQWHLGQKSMGLCLLGNIRAWIVCCVYHPFSPCLSKPIPLMAYLSSGGVMATVNYTHEMFRFVWSKMFISV